MSNSVATLDLVTLRGAGYVRLVDGRVEPQVRYRGQRNAQLRNRAEQEGLKPVTAQRGGRDVVDTGSFGQERAVDGDMVAGLLESVPTTFGLYVHDVDERSGKTKKKVEIRVGIPNEGTEGLIPNEDLEVLIDAIGGRRRSFLWNNGGSANLVVLDQGTRESDLEFDFVVEGDTIAVYEQE